MELRAGYKQTEVGVIPQDWDCVPIVTVALLESGHTPSRKNPNYWNGSVQWISLHDTEALDGREIAATAKRITEDGLKHSSARLLPLGTVVFSRTATVGKSTVMATSMATSQDFANYICGPKLHNHFLVYLFRHMRPTWQRLMAGSIHNTIYMPVFKALEIVLPPLQEQIAIAETLNDVDALLAGLDRLISKRRDLKKAAMQELLTGQTRLAGFRGEWKVERLGQLGSTYGGLSSKTKADFGVGDAQYVTFINVMTNVVVDCERFDYVRVKASEPQNRVLRGDLLFNGSSETPEEVAMCALLTQDVPNLYLNSFCFGFRLRSESAVDGLFLAYYIRGGEGREIMKSLAQGSTRYNVSKRALLDAKVRLPPLSEQTAISAVLADMDAEISALEARREKTLVLKHAMMDELLTGRTRLVESSLQENRKRSGRIHGRGTNIHFRRSVFAAEIIDRLHEEPTFGHVKFQKLLFLAERVCNVDIGTTYHRHAAGPYDARAIRSIDGQLRKQKWFGAQERDRRYRYVPMEKRGGHREYFDRYFSEIRPTFDTIIETFRAADTERCEIVATLFAAWADLVRQHGAVTDEEIVHEVLHNWHDSKKRIAEDRWRKALGWMRQRGFVPIEVGHSRIAPSA